jgi:hypothetical protein
VIDKPIIYVGEWHTLYEDHKVQLEVIRALHKENRKFAIGMEMFQKPYQQSLDDYISGASTEKEFLKSSEYFKRWKFNYHLYREILDFARANDIPVVALNQEEEIIKKVSDGGLDELDEDERARSQTEDSTNLTRTKERASLWTWTCPTKVTRSGSTKYSRSTSLRKEKPSIISIRPRYSGTRPWPTPWTIS